MTSLWPTVALSPLLLLSACADSHETRAAGDLAQAASCPSTYLAESYGSAIFLFENQNNALSPAVDWVLTDEDGGSSFSVVSNHDFDGDGMRDVVIRESYGGAALLEEDVLLWLIRGTDQPFSARPVEAINPGMRAQGGTSMEGAGDLDADGTPDLVINGALGPNVVSGATFTATSLRCDRARSIGDVDGDEVPDTYCQDGVRLTQGASPDFGDAIDEMGPLGDVNGDGLSDVWARLDGDWQVLLGPDLSESSFFSERALIALGDVNGDGFDDVARHVSGAFELFQGSRDGLVLLNEAFSTTGDEPASESAAGDLNCDGYADVFGSRGGNRVVRFGSPAGLVGEPTPIRDIRGSLTPVFD